MNTKTTTALKPPSSSQAKARIKGILKSLTNSEATAFRGSIITPLGLLIAAAASFLIPFGIWELLMFLDNAGFFETRIGAPLQLVLFFFVFMPACGFALAMGIIMPIVILANIAGRRFAMTTAKAEKANIHLFSPATQPEKTLGEWTSTALSQVLIIEPLFILKKGVQLLTLLMKKVLKVNTKWVTEQEAYYQDQMEIFRFLLLNHTEEEALDYLFESSYGAHYGPAHERQWFHGKNPSIIANLDASEKSDLTAARKRWLAGTAQKVLRELESELGWPEWMYKKPQPETAEATKKILAAPGPCRLRNGSVIKAMKKSPQGRKVLIIE